MSGYDPARHWSDVARRLRERAQGKQVAGDDAPYYRYKRTLFLKEFLPALPVEGRSVLEVGCGPGGNLRELASRRPGRLVGCDIAPGMVELASDAVAGLGVEVRLVNGATLPFSDGDFEMSFTVTVLQHNPDSSVASLAAEMARVTTSSIYLIEDTVSGTNANSSAAAGNYGNFFPRSAAALSNFFDSQGFELTRSVSLQTRVSWRVFHLLERLFDRGRRKEGEPYSRAHLIAGQMMLPLTSIVDRYVPSETGELTLIELTRR